MKHPVSTHYIDIHAHDKMSRSSVFCLPSVFIQKIEVREAMNTPFSCGLHPWHLNDINVEDELNSLRMLSGNEMLRAIGECGLDRNVSVNIELQKRVFIEHIKIANHHQKPLIIHAVKSFSDFLNILNSETITSKWIFHGFNANKVIANKLLKYENVYFSFGSALLKERSKTSEVFKALPMNRIFLETDEGNDSIESIYQRAASLLQTEELELKKQLFMNYTEVFND